MVPEPVHRVPGTEKVPGTPAAGPAASSHSLVQEAAGPAPRPASGPTVQRDATPVQRARRSAPPARRRAPERRETERREPERREAARREPERPDEVDLDELARRLVGPLSRLLRAELRMDRERVGRLRDSRTY
ncbi:hypothetical protein GCM10022254_02650 [Actinomadura meridiana]|uniref:Extensin n=1 Tax=Actinomadura meridiana TaxID=559626 RepID=A0ABP8BRV1_9ACTN